MRNNVVRYTGVHAVVSALTGTEPLQNRETKAVAGTDNIPRLFMFFGRKI
jgi:hypothetical protein